MTPAKKEPARGQARKNSTSIPAAAEAGAGGKHTPGPWKSVYCGRSQWMIRCDHSLLNDDRRTDVLAEINDPVPYLSADENSANAALIAAAPDLLRLVESIQWDGQEDLEESGYAPACPVCGAYAPHISRQLGERVGHEDDCELDRVLKAALGEVARG